MSDIKPVTVTKKPIRVKAMQFVDVESGRKILEWVHSTDPDLPIRMVHNQETIKFIEVQTIEGTMRGGPGWWIIQGVKGEFYPCAPEIFDESYTVNNDGITPDQVRILHLTTDTENDISHPTVAKRLVQEWAVEGLGVDKNTGFYVVWFCYILGGWKALVSSTAQDARYYEVTYNFQKNEVYIDTYRKTHNNVVTFESAD